MRSSSKEAYAIIIDKLPKCRLEVLKAIRTAKKPVCDRDIADQLGWTINRVTGRRGELENLGLIESVGRLENKHSKVRVYHFVANS